MRLSKLEPHVIQPTLDNADVDLFLNDVEEEQKAIQQISAESAPPEGEPEGRAAPPPGDLVHLMDFLRRRQRLPPRSKKGIALLRYEAQKQAVPSAAEQEVQELSKFRKYA